MLEKTKRKIAKTLKGRHPINEFRKGEKHPWAKNNPQIFKEGHIPWHKGKKLSEEHKRKISEWMKGKRIGSESPVWKGGITSLRSQVYHCFKYRQWRSDIFSRDDFICQNCNRKGCLLEAHHIKRSFTILKEYEIKTLEQALNCEELWNINNGLTLCKKCHNLIKR